MSPIDIAYAAGFFDGEGYIGICGSASNGSLCLQIEVTQVDPRPLQFMASKFGGVVKHRVWAQYKSKRNSRPSFVWRLHAKTAINFLQQIYPYLIHKKDQADLAFQFQNIRNLKQKSSPEKKQGEVGIKNQLQHEKKIAFEII